MDIEKLQTFHCVVRSGSFTETAKMQNLTISGVRKQINVLEQELGHKLLKTIHQRVFPTNKGILFFQETQSILEQYGAALHALREEDGSMRGVLKLSTTSALASLWIVDDIANFLKKYPEFQLTVIGQDEEPDFSLQEVDVAIRPYIKHRNANLEQKYLESYHMCLYASEAYLLDYGIPHSPEELRNHKIIAYGDNIIYPYQEINWHLDLLPREKKVAFNINSGGGILRAVENGLGIAPISQEAAKVSRVPLIKILPQLNGHTIDVYYVYSKFLANSFKVTELYNYLKNQVKEKRTL